MKHSEIPGPYIRLIIQASNISQGGGKSLLNALLEGISSSVEILLLVDSRMQLPNIIAKNLILMPVYPSALQRLRAQWWLFRNVRHTDTILFFGNIPPLFKLRGRSSVFIQNRYLVEKYNLEGFSHKTRLRLIFERARLKFTASNADEFIVQSPSMKAALVSSGCVGNQAIYIRPFVSISDGYKRLGSLKENRNDAKKYDFIYVASGEPHKNHLRLIEAWCLLADQNLYPSLCLTLDISESVDLWTRIVEKKLTYSLDLENVGIVPHSQILLLYNESKALIFPSLIESFGLPLVEARQTGLPIVASELDYVRDLIDPEETFDPNSPKSIARAVKRFMGVAEEPLPLFNASQFFKSIFDKELQ